jgi:hypothetical protein
LPPVHFKAPSQVITLPKDLKEQGKLISAVNLICCLVFGIKKQPQYEPPSPPPFSICRYYRDTKQPPPKGDMDIAAQAEDTGPEIFKPPQPVRRKAAEALLQEAEEQFGNALQQVQIVDAKGLKRLVANLERKVSTFYVFE